MLNRPSTLEQESRARSLWNLGGGIALGAEHGGEALASNLGALAQVQARGGCIHTQTCKDVVCKLASHHRRKTSDELRMQWPREPWKGTFKIHREVCNVLILNVLACYIHVHAEIFLIDTHQ